MYQLQDHDNSSKGSARLLNLALPLNITAHPSAGVVRRGYAG